MKISQSVHRLLSMVALGLAFLCLCVGSARAGESVILVDVGRPRAVVVTAHDPSPVAAYAAEELAAQVEKATGARLPVLSESDLAADDTRARVYVGDTKAARKTGLDPSGCRERSFASRWSTATSTSLDGKTGRNLSTGKPARSFATHDEVRYTAWLISSSALSAFAGYGPVNLGRMSRGASRWRWPPELDATGSPAFRFRQYRIWGVERAATQGYKSEIEGRLGFSPEGVRAYHKALCRYLLIHQEGETEPQPQVGHHFQWWWGKHGKKHPTGSR